jgi:hypothetical protein
MRSLSFNRFVLACAVYFLSFAPGLRAQTAPAVWTQSAPVDMPTQLAPMVMPGAMPTLLPWLHSLKGAPLTASFTMESRQVLTDGTTITNTRTGKVARDSEGRTYNETASARLGGANHRTYTTININDPISGAQITLLPETHTAHRFERMQRSGTAAGVPSEPQTFSVAGNTGTVMTRTSEFTSSSFPSVHKEDLGVESIEGISVRHYRETQTIAAGEIGNDRDLVITSEFWYATDLHLNLKATRSDPRLGEETLSLTDVQRMQPPASLFEIPADYALVESSMGAAGFASSSGSIHAAPPVEAVAKP